MGQWSIGVCTPIPMVPVDSGGIVMEKVAKARALLEDEAVNLKECRRLLDEAYAASKDESRHLGLITPEWHRARTALVCPPGHSLIEVYADGMEVGVARCSAVQAARESGLKYLFFNDWDTITPSDALLKLAYYMDNNPDVGVVSGVYVMKSIPPFPLIWRSWNEGVFFDWTPGDTLENLVGAPMGCALLRLSLFDSLPQTPETPWFKTVADTVKVGHGWQQQRLTEDLYFCIRYVRESAGKISVDTSILCEHICHHTGRRYRLGDDSLPMKRMAAEAALAAAVALQQAKAAA